MSQARAAYAAPGDVADMKQVATRLESDNPLWIVLFGIYSRQFVAFPRFAVPEGTVISVRHPGAMWERMRQIEHAARIGQVEEQDPVAQAALADDRDQ